MSASEVTVEDGTAVDGSPGATRDALIARALKAQNRIPPDKLVRTMCRLFDFVDGGEDQFSFPALTTAIRGRIFGGQVIAQAMMAAAQTVDPARQVHSLHAYFLRPGNETLPLDFQVHRDMDGGSFSNRRVVVRQAGEVIFNLTASFQRPAEGLAHQVAMPELLPPEQCVDFTELLASDGRMDAQTIAQIEMPRPFEMRSHRPPLAARATGHYQWFRLRSGIGDNPLLHRAFLAFASDMGLLSSSMLPHALTWTTPGVQSTSLDHAMWFHDDVRVDDWFVYVMDSDWTGHTRGMNHGRIYQQGRLVATTAQEGLVRYKPPLSA